MFFLNKLILNLLACGLMLSQVQVVQARENSRAPAKENNRAKNHEQTQTTRWQRFAARENSFAVDFPSTPEQMHQTIEIPKTEMKISYDTYMSEPNESIVFVVSVWHYPAQLDMSRPEINLKDGFKGMLSALSGSKVIHSQMSDFQGFKALDFLVQNEEIYFQGKLLLVYNTLYQVFAVYKEGAPEENVERFLNSFQLLEPERQKIESKESNQKVNV
jgi:hypothetical protein